LDAAPGAKAILFGSYARGQADSDSDVDFLVVEPEVADAGREMVRLRSVLSGFPTGVDLIVMSQEQFDYWRETPNILPYRAVEEGRTYG
jgi:predicted nucleotidyltransferase